MCIFDTKYCNFISSKEIWKPRHMIINLESLLKHYKMNVKFNMMTKTIEFNIPDLLNVSIHNYNEVCLQYILDLCVYHDLNLTSNTLYSMLVNIADKNKYHPVKELILQKYQKYKNFEETEIKKLFDTIQTETYFPNELKKELIKTWLVSCVKAVFEPYIKSEGVLVLQGPQGIYKTTLLKHLGMREEFVKDGHFLDPAIKDTVLEAINYWIVELGELEDTLKKEMGRLKAFISKDMDEVRRPFSRISSKYPRQTIFCASVNESEFLKDNTGNRRWWVIPCVNIDRKLLMQIDIEKLWTEIYKLYLNNYPHILDRETEKELSSINTNFEVVCLSQSNILKTYDFESSKRSWIPFSQIRKDLSSYKISDTKIATILRKLNIETKTINGRRYKLMPSKRMDWINDAMKLK